MIQARGAWGCYHFYYYNFGTKKIHYHHHSKASKLMQSYLFDWALFVLSNNNETSIHMSLKSWVWQEGIWLPPLF